MVQDTMGRRRPLGITIISIIAAIHGILGIIAGISTLRASAALAVIALILGILVLVLAWGLWTLQRWAFWSLVVVEALYLITGIVALFARSAGPGIVDILIALIVLIYMFADSNVRAAFET